MARTKLTAVLSKDSFNQLANKVELFGQQYIKGLQLGIEEATNQCYQLISQKMETYGLSDHIGNIKVEFDLKNNIGKIDNIYVMDKKMACDNNLVRLCSLHGVKIRIISNIIEDKEIVDIM